MLFENELEKDCIIPPPPPEKVNSIENELEKVKTELREERQRCKELEEQLAEEKQRRQQAEKQLQIITDTNTDIDVEKISKQRLETEEQVAQLKRELELMRYEREKIARQVETEQEFLTNNLFKKLELASGSYDTSAAGSSRRTSRSSSFSVGGSFSVTIHILSNHFSHAFIYMFLPRLLCFLVSRWPDRSSQSVWYSLGQFDGLSFHVS